ncbi:hypothetical protein ACW5EG_13315 [Luteimonas sp. A611]
MKIMLLAPIVLCFSAIAFAESVPSAPETSEAKFIRLNHQIEQDPLSDSDKSVRGWLLKWAIDSKDITVIACDVLGNVSRDDIPYNGIYVTQMMFGNAAYQISHPDKRNDLLATQLAGARSSLQAYTSILTSHPEARVPHFDDLINKDKAGTLEAYLEPVVADKCKETGGG